MLNRHVKRITVEDGFFAEIDTRFNVIEKVEKPKRVKQPSKLFAMYSLKKKKKKFKKIPSNLIIW